ncbi:hypothetical protein NUW54_g11466 [Trametes sanguinea]|uniref:Uncharacterized protein n=1 Tax=Trametes sanguinea TaxID=158606 RepID=A0ACC1NCN7_9APHY|nr:hypothetical protein NUW54_g11466 [Trametes sanguinea]
MTRLSTAKRQKILDLYHPVNGESLSLSEIAHHVHCDRSTVRRVLQRVSSSGKLNYDICPKGRPRILSKQDLRELYDFLVQLVKDGNIPAPDPENTKGGIILAGWSFGTGLITAFLANVASFPVGEVRLGDYMRRVVFLDPPHHVLGYPLPENPYNPLFDPTIPAEERERAFTNWVSGYYVHGDTPDTLERKTPLLDPPPTLSTLTPEEISRTLSLGPGAPGGSDAHLLHFGIKLGLYEPLRKGALYQPPQDLESGDALRNVEVRYVSCERSVWEMPWGTMYLEKELEDARVKRLPLRNVRLVFVKDANHFVQWDRPEHALRALVGDENVVR